MRTLAREALAAYRRVPLPARLLCAAAVLCELEHTLCGRTPLRYPADH